MLNISKQIYAGWSSVATNELPEADIIPDGDLPAEKIKIDKFIKKYSITREIENKPMPGFTLFKVNRERFGSKDPTWLIIDPRGFLTRITNANLEQLLQVTGITEGLIQEECVWARQNHCKDMELIPVNSELYLEATSNTELLENKVKMSDVGIGDTVLLQNKLIGVYLGTVNLYGGIENLTTYTSSPPKVKVFPKRQVIQLDSTNFYFQSDLKILKIIKKSDENLSKEGGVRLINEAIALGNSHITSSVHSNRIYFGYDIINHASLTLLKDIPITLTEIDKNEALKLYTPSNGLFDSSKLVLEDQNKSKFIINCPWTHSFSSSKLSTFEIIQITVDETSFKTVPTSCPGYSLDKFVKFYKIVKHVKEDTYV